MIKFKFKWTNQKLTNTTTHQLPSDPRENYPYHLIPLLRLPGRRATGTS
jgi:hypothetical protein